MKPTVKTRLSKVLFDFALSNGLLIKRTTKQTQLEQLFEFLRPKASKVPMVRLGSERDGGYLVPTVVDRVQFLWSAGVADDAAMELDFVSTSESRQAFLIDGSIAELPAEHPQFRFTKAYLGQGKIFERELSLAEWLATQSATKGKAMLSMDIEGGEYQVFVETPGEVLNKFDLIVMELHGLENIFDPMFFDSHMTPMLNKLADWQCLHLHVNNALPPVRGPGGLGIYPLLELTLAHKRLNLVLEEYASLPHQLDADNVTNRPPADLRVLNWL